MIDALSPIAALLIELARRRIELRAVEGRVQYRPRTAMTEEPAARIRAHKGELLTVLQEPQAAVSGQRGLPLPVDVGERQVYPQERGEPTRVPCLAECVATSYVYAGWTPGSWAARLRQLAARCEGLHPEFAGMYRLWAQNIGSKENPLA